MKKILLVLLCLLMLCSCSKKSEEKDNIFKKDDVSYFEYKDTKIYLHDEYKKYIDQFKKLNCKYITRTGEDDEEISLKDLKDDSKIYLLDKGDSFIITCNSSNNESTVNFTEYFSSSEGKYTERKINEWHVSSTNEELDIVIGKKTLYLGADKYETVKTLKEKLGKPDSESKTEKGNLDRIIYVNDNFKYEFLVLNPINNDVNNRVYNLYVTKIN